MKSLSVRSAAVALVLTIAIAPAHASWEGTEWGMSPAQALVVLDGASSHQPAKAEIYEDNGASYAPLVKLDHAIEGVEGTVSLLFDMDERLHFVLFNPRNVADCDALGAALTERYGAAEAAGAGSMSISDWQGDGNSIKLTSFAGAGICNLSYSRL